MPILYLERNQVTVAFPEEGGENMTKSLGDLASLLQQVKQKDVRNPWRVLLSEDLVYETVIPIPPGTANEQAYIAEQLGKMIPDRLESSDWSFTLKNSANGKQATIFAPVPGYWRPVRAALEKAEVPVSAITTTLLAREQDKDVLMGAIKTAIPAGIAHWLLPVNISTIRIHPAAAILVVLALALLAAFLFAVLN